MSDQYAYTGPMPDKGHVGYVNMQATDCGERVRFTIRSEGDDPLTTSYEVPMAEAIALLGRALIGLGGPLKHDFWMPGEAECPREIKAPNGEIHTLRCKRCGEDNPRGKICVG